MLFSSKSPDKQHYSHGTNAINTDFEWPKISAIQKGFQVLNSEHSNLYETKVDPDLHYISKYSQNTLSETLVQNENEKKEIVNNDEILNNTNNDCTKRNIVFSNKKLLLENELLRKEQVKKEVERKKEEIEHFSRNLMHQKAQMVTIMAQRRQEEQFEKNQCLEKEEEIIDERIRQNELCIKNAQQFHKMSIQEKIAKLECEQAEYMQLIKRKKELLEIIKPYAEIFQSKVETINWLITSCKDPNFAIATLTPCSQQFQELQIQMDILREKTHELENITHSEVEWAKNINLLADQIINVYAAETDRINKMFGNNIIHRAPAIKPAEFKSQVSSQPQLATIDKVESSNTVIQSIPQSTECLPHLNNDSKKTFESSIQDNLKSCAVVELWSIYTTSEKYLEHFQISHAEFLQNESLKKFRFDCQKAITTPVNTISSIDRDHLIDKFNKVINFLRGKSTPNIGLHPQGISFSIYTLAKKIVTQGEAVISSKPEMAFSIASFAIATWNEFPEFGNMLIAQFHTICPYVVPIWLPQQQSDKDHINLKKISGILRLYASIIVSRQRQSVTKTHPHGLGNAWRWLAATLNIEPKADTVTVIATLVFDMLEVVGHFMLIAYPKQFPKMLNVLYRDFFPQLQKLADDSGGPVSRLEEFLVNSISSGGIPPPTRLLPPNFW